MLFYYSTSADQLETIRKKGIKGPVALFTSLEDAEAKRGGVVLVIQGYKIKYKPTGKKKKKVKADGVSPDALLNIDPYLPPCRVIAGGGYVIRSGKKEPEVLLIYRKGVWDLPKGKLDEGESIEECALREVREEVGIDRLVMKGTLGNTVHGYARNNKYKVKTTHWYHMETPEREFKPQAEEDIEKVAWVPWSKAVSSVGYEIFRRHMNEIQSLVAA